MRQVNIYTQSSIRSLKPQDGAIGYLLEMKTERGPVTLSKIDEIQNVTANQSELQVLIEALKRLKEICMLTIYTESSYVAAGYEKGWVKKWIQNGWQTARKKEVSNRTEWEELTELIEKHPYSFRIEQEHEYRDWLQMEVARKEKLQEGGKDDKE